MNATIKRYLGYCLICLAVVASILLLVEVGPIHQDNSYHHFSDQHSCFGIDNVLNVLSNVPFVLVGVWFLAQLAKSSGTQNRASLAMLYIGSILVGFGSGYYHIDPNSSTLVWDRLPMTISFMSLFALALGDHFKSIRSHVVLLPLLAIGVASVFHWWLGDSAGEGDLRLYVLVQFLPLLLLPMFLVFFSTDSEQRKPYIALIACYLVAKIAEHYDEAIHETLGIISGHSIKHLVSALGLYLFGRAFHVSIPKGESTS